MDSIPANVIDGTTGKPVPFFVDYPEEPAAKRGRTDSTEVVVQALQEMKVNILEVQRAQVELRRHILPGDLTGTPGDRAKKRRKQHEPTVSEMEEKPDLEPIVLPTAAIEAMSEADFNKAMAPLLASFKPKHILVNSETLQWNFPGIGKGSADYFAARCYSPRTSRDSRNFGVPAFRELVSALYEGKLQFEPADEDQLHRYLTGTSASRGMLYDKKGFLLMEVSGVVGVDKTLRALHKGKWSVRGALKFIQDFFEEDPPHDKRLQRCLDHGRLHVEAFLGRSQNTVYGVKRRQGDEEQLAMKIVTVDDAVYAARREHELLKNCFDLGLPVVQPVGDVEEVDVEIGAVYFLSKPIGAKVSKEFAKDNVGKIFESLAALHGKNRVHGDARLDNLISSNDKLLWIDLMQSPQSVECAKKRDIVTLCTSMGLKEGWEHDCAVSIDWCSPDFVAWVTASLKGTHSV